MKKVFITESEKLKIRKMYGLLTEEKTLTLPSVSEKTCDICFDLEQGIFDLESGVYELQSFLIAAGHDIPYDGNFGNKTATALGTWVWGYKEGINTPRKLAEKMTKIGWDVGKITDTPYGPKMAIAISKMIKKICDGYSASCIKMRKDILKTYEPRLDFEKQRQNFNPDKIPNLKKQKQFCETKIKELIPQVKQDFINWINNPKTQQKLNPTFIKFSPQQYLPVEVIRNVINSINKNIYTCQGPYDHERFFQKKSLGFYNPNTNNIKINYEDFDPSKLLILLIHETTHWIEGNLPFGFRQTINRTDKVKDVYPLSQKTKWQREIFDNQLFIKTSIKNVSAESMNQLKSIGVSKEWIEYLIDQWNKELKNKDDVKYECSRQEKEANLKSVRKMYTGTLFGELTKENLKNIIQMKKGVSDEYHFTICWVGNNFNPKPFEFLKLSNDLAVNEKPTDDTNIQNNQTINLDFSDIDPQA